MEFGIGYQEEKTNVWAAWEVCMIIIPRSSVGKKHVWMGESYMYTCRHI